MSAQISFMNAAALAALVLFAAVLISDLLTMRISNRLVVALSALYLVAAPVSIASWSQIVSTIVTAAAVFAAGFFMFARGWVGGGDVKFVGAAMLWVGAEHAIDYLLHASVLGGFLTLGVLAFRAAPLPVPVARSASIARLHEKGGKVPYGVALAAAAMLILPKTFWFSSVPA